MELLTGLLFAMAVLFLWLSCHWFGRVLAFIAFGALFGLLGFIALGQGQGGAGYGLIGLLLGLALAWVVASLPIWWQRRLRKAELEALSARRWVVQPRSDDDLVRRLATSP